MAESKIMLEWATVRTRIDVTTVCSYTDFNETKPVTYQTPPYRAAVAQGLNPVRRSGDNFNHKFELGERARKCFNKVYAWHIDSF
jgi:hypothetical protein